MGETTKTPQPRQHDDGDAGGGHMWTVVGLLLPLLQ
jgi:hypothetical protein